MRGKGGGGGGLKSNTMEVMLPVASCYSNKPTVVITCKLFPSCFFQYYNQLDRPQ